MGVRNGSSYIAGLHDDREVWADGARVLDVALHPPFLRSVRCIAGYFDWQLQHAEDCVTTHPEIGPIGASHLIPRSQSDLQRRHRCLERLAEYSAGLLGRTPDYLNVALAGYAGLRSVWSGRENREGWENLVAFQQECADRDLALTHAIVHPVTDHRDPKFGGVNEANTLRKVRDTENGIIVRGSRVLATLAPFSDEIVVHPGTPIPAGSDDLAVSFAIPLSTPGLKVICRDHFGSDRPTFDEPISSVIDEQDAFVVFDDVEIPGDRVFINGDADTYQLIRVSGWMPNVMQQTCIRAMTKLRFGYELCSRLALALGLQRSNETSAMLGEVWSYGELVRCGLAAAEEGAKEWSDGVWFCDPRPFLALRPSIPIWMSRLNAVIRAIGSHNLLTNASQGTLRREEVRPFLDQFLAGADGMSAFARARLFRTAWDLVGSSLGSRMELYEMFYLGSSASTYREAHRVAGQDIQSQVPNLLCRIADIGQME